MSEQEDGLSSIELKFSNVAADGVGGSDFAFEDETAFKLGDTVSVYCGDEYEPTQIFSGIVTGLEATFTSDNSPTLTVLAEDALQKARMSRRSRAWQDQSIADIARTIAQDLGLQPQIDGFSDTSGTYAQLNESDLAFLRRLLARHDGDLQVVAQELHVAPRANVQRGALDLELHSQLRHARILADLAHQVDEVQVHGYDAARGEGVTGSSAGTDRGPGRGRQGANFLADALGRRTHHISHLALRDQTEADAIAQAAFDERRRRFVTVTGTAEGNPALRVGAHATLMGLGPRFSNTYYITSCRHRFDREQGYETDFTGECAFLGEP